jgi:hypothetical protein
MTLKLLHYNVPHKKVFLEHVRTTHLLDPVDKFTEWEQFESLVSESISPRIQINFGDEADKADCDFTAFISSVYTLPTCRLLSRTLIRIHLVWSLLNHKRRLRKMWQVTQDPACKTAVNWVAKTIR